MVGIPSPLGGSETEFDAYDEFVPGNVPPPGEFLDRHDVLAGREHLAVHRLARELFEERGVYDMTFGYNLARLNNDPRHPAAGYRYAVESPDAEDAVDPESLDATDPRVLRAEFTPTTAFCPQSDTLTRGSFRAWNGLPERHEFDLVRVRVAPMHQRSVAINGELKQLETAFLKTGEVPADDGDADPRGNSGSRAGAGTNTDDDTAGPPAGGPTVPF